MKKKPITLKALKLKKESVTSLQNQQAIKGGASNNQLCYPPDDGTRNSDQCATQQAGICPRDSDLCYSGHLYISQCCV